MPITPHKHRGIPPAVCWVNRVPADGNPYSLIYRLAGRAASRRSKNRTTVSSIIAHTQMSMILRRFPRIRLLQALLEHNRGMQKRSAMGRRDGFAQADVILWHLA